MKDSKVLGTDKALSGNFQFTERESELIYFALSRMLDDFAIDGVQDVNDNDEINQIIDLREKFAQINIGEQSK